MQDILFKFYCIKIQKRISKQGKNKYLTYVITIPKTIIEIVPELRKVFSDFIFPEKL